MTSTSSGPSVIRRATRFRTRPACSGGAWRTRASRFDPEKADPSFDRMVLVGHSMGGLLARMMVVESGTRLWGEVSDRPFDELVGEPDDRNLFGQALLIKPLPGVRRVVFIATPHRGSQAQPRLAAKPGRAARARDRAAAVGLRPAHRTQHPRLLHEGFSQRPADLDRGAGVGCAVSQAPARTGGFAGREVPFDHRSPPRCAPGGANRWPGQLCEAHLEGADSEIVISAGHLCQDHPDAIREVRRVLVEHRNTVSCRFGRMSGFSRPELTDRPSGDHGPA